MRSNRDLAQDVLAELLEVTSAERILDYLVVNYLSGTTALQGLQEYKSELFGDDEEEEEDVEDADDREQRELEEIRRIEEDE